MTKTRDRRRGEWKLALSALIILTAAGVLSLRKLAPPPVADLTAPDSEFSAERASRHLERIARKPHPPGSEEHRAVQEYLAQEIRALGLEPDIRTQTEVAKRRGWLSVAGTVSNICARLEGSEGGRAVLLMAHYDSVSTGPGANDNATAVAALLETLRALKAGPKLKNDVILVFSDAEEAGLLGAQTFVDSHPWADDVGVALNFEARGDGGPSMMFETSRGNLQLARALSSAAPGAIATSLSHEIYQRMPNDTDFSILKRAGYPGMNFAYIGGLTAYHTRLDDLSSVDLRSLQHHGDYALGLTRHFGDTSLREANADDAVYFNLPATGLIAYGSGWVMPASGVALLALAWVVAWGIRSKRLRPLRLGIGLLWFLGLLLAIPALTAVLWLIVAGLHESYRWMPLGETYNGPLYLLFFLFVTLATGCFLFRLARKRLSLEELLAGALAVWAILMILSSLAFPGGSYLFTWPTLFGTAGLGLLLMRSDQGENFDGSLVIASLAAVPGVLLAVPVVYLVHQALTTSMSGILMIPAVLLLGLLLPQVELLQRCLGRWLAGGAAAAALALLAAGSLTSGFDQAHPKPNSLFYVMDRDSSQALWASSDHVPDRWTSIFLGDEPSRGPLSDQFPVFGYPFLQGSAAADPALDAPEIRLLSHHQEEGGQRIRFKVRSMRGAEQLWVNVAPGMEIRSAAVEGHALNARRNASHPWSLRFVGPPAQGIEMELEIIGLAPIGIQAVDRTSGLPPIAKAIENPRPSDMMAAPIFDEFQDATFVAGSLAFELPAEPAPDG